MRFLRLAIESEMACVRLSTSNASSQSTCSSLLCVCNGSGEDALDPVPASASASAVLAGATFSLGERRDSV